MRLTVQDIDFILEKNNITFENTNLYLDFTVSLYTLIFDTYMGDEIMGSESRLKHFEWCWNKNIGNFKKEGVYFNDDYDFRTFFSNYAYQLFYLLGDDKTSKTTYENIVRLWGIIFDFTSIREKENMDSFIKMYNLFHKNLIKTPF